MAMLAERKIKQKWSQDPRNKAWSSDTDRFGYQMLTKMGWSDGKGLGASESGSTSHVKISLKNDNLGVGAKVSHDDNWLAHQDDFNDLLAQLNSANNTGKAGGEQSAKNDMESIARKSKKRVFYERFIKSKNTSSYSATDMACILGKRSKSAPDTPVDQSEDEDSDGSCASCPALHETNSLGLTTINSSQSVQEYFAMKMAELKKKREQKQSSEELAEGNSTEEKLQGLNAATCNLELQEKQKKRKQKCEKNSKKERKKNDEESKELSSSDLENGGQHIVSKTDKMKRKKKKDRKRKLKEDEEVVKTKKRQKLCIELSHKDECNDGSEKVNKDSKKKKKKAKKDLIDSGISTKIDDSATADEVLKKAKKFKLESQDFEENAKIRDKKKQKKKKKQSTNEKYADLESDVSKKDKKTKSKTTKDYSKKKI